MHNGVFDPNVFTRWQRSGELIKLRNGVYLRSDFQIRGDVDRFLIAGNLYHPSYISLYSALRYYNFIPESVYEVTSVSTRKSKSFTVRDTTYTYRHLKDNLFFGYQVVQWKGEPFLMATPEKALLDLAYLEPQFSEHSWVEGMRFDMMEIEDRLNWVNMFLYADIIGSDTVKKRITVLIETLWP